MVVRFNRIVTVPHCYPSVVLNTLETAIEVSVGVEVEFIVTGERTRVAVQRGTEVNRTSRTEVTSIVTSDATTMSSDAVVKAKRRAADSVPLVDFRETMSTRGWDDEEEWVKEQGENGDQVQYENL